MATSVSDADGQDATQYLRSVLSERLSFVEYAEGPARVWRHWCLTMS